MITKQKIKIFDRQGKWLFLPACDLQVDVDEIKYDEPLERYGDRPHIAEYYYRTGGERIYLCRQYRKGLTESQYRDLIIDNPRARNYRWTMIIRDYEVFACGSVWQCDCQAIYLSDWHQVYVNREIVAGNMVCID